MYIPNSFKNKNIEEVKSFLSKNSFGILINQNNGRITGSHIPLELDTNENGEDILTGHISKANPQWENFSDNEEILAIFSGSHSYVSSSWYQKENVPTWNYIAVHIYGTLEIITGDELRNSLKKLVDKYEENSENPVSVDRLSDSTMKQINGIVGFNINITEVQAAYKLSQNRDDADYHTIIEKLEKTEDPNSIGVANEMKAKRDCKS